MVSLITWGKDKRRQHFHCLLEKNGCKSCYHCTQTTQNAVYACVSIYEWACVYMCNRMPTPMYVFVSECALCVCLTSCACSRLFAELPTSTIPSYLLTKLL